MQLLLLAVYYISRKVHAMKDSKQLDCQLHCKASAELQEDVAKDLQLKDKSLGELLDDCGHRLTETESAEQVDGKDCSSHF